MDDRRSRVSVVVVTALYGDLDELTDPPPMFGVDDYIAVTDRERDCSILSVGRGLHCRGSDGFLRRKNCQKAPLDGAFWLYVVRRVVEEFEEAAGVDK